jgi:hypothetical protein
MIEIAIRISVYLIIGLALLTCNIWFARAVVQGITGGDLVVAPVKVVGRANDTSLTGEAMARLIISRLQTLASDLQQSQSSLRQADDPTTGAVPIGVAAGILGIPKTAVLEAQLFEPTSIDVKVAGVDVGGLLPRIQRWFIEDRTLTFSVSWEEKSAIIAGNIDALGLGKTKPIWMSIKDPTLSSVADAIALALIHRLWAKDRPEFGALDHDEFKVLVDAVNQVAAINSSVMTSKAPAPAEFERVLATIGPLADSKTWWNQLTYFTASVAESAEKYERALGLYRRMAGLPQAPLAGEALKAKIAGLEALTQGRASNKQAPAQKLKEEAAVATNILNELFDLKLGEPSIAIISDDVRNAYWDGRQINVPSVVQDIPDIVYHEATFPFLQKVWSFKYEGQEGAMVVSYTDILTSLIKQRTLEQNDKNADWTIAPGAVAWISGKFDDIGRDKRPLRSLKAPGTAYDDPVIGKDPQVDHFTKLVNLPNTPSADYGGIHTNSGIPSRAFYETARQIGSQRAGKIWIDSLRKFKPDLTIVAAAKLIYETAVGAHGAQSAEAKGIKAGWNAVGVSL